jgi:Magnesium chelatase, subunit ChlI
MLARRLTTILPAMTLAEAIETTRIHRGAGLTAFVTTRPCRAPHHTISAAGLIGGGQVPLPREGSVAHNGVLFLDELPEFRRHVLEVLRQPLEKGFTRTPSPGHPRSRRLGCTGGAGTDRRSAASARIVRSTAHRSHTRLSPVPPGHLGAVWLLLLTRTILGPRTRPPARLGEMSDELALDIRGRPP